MSRAPAPDPRSQSTDTIASAFLGSLPTPELRTLREQATTRRFGRGRPLFYERQHPDRVVILLSGAAKLSCLTEGGREVILGIAGAGDLIGDLAAVDGGPHAATATALDEIEALVLPTSSFHALIESRPRIAVALLRLIVHRTRERDRGRIAFAARDTLGRVATRLVELMERFGRRVEGGIEIELPLTQEELGAWSDSSREAVTRALQTLRELELVETGRRRIVVRDTEGLRAQAGISA